MLLGFPGGVVIMKGKELLIGFVTYILHRARNKLTPLDRWLLNAGDG
jgi:hypothetical protein